MATLFDTFSPSGHPRGLRVLMPLIPFIAILLFLTGCGGSTVSSVRPDFDASAAMPAPAPVPAPMAASSPKMTESTGAYRMPPMVAAMAPAPPPDSNFAPTAYSGLEYNTEEYDRIVDNPFLKAMDNPVSTFSIDVDTASYANLRRFLVESREMPPKDAVRIEEMLNYFTYSYPAPTSEHPVAAYFSMTQAPWAPDHWLLRVALKTKEIETAQLPASNLVFLLDTSGSMMDENKLPLLKDSLKILIEKLRPEDRVSIVAYAGTTGLILDSTSAAHKETIINAFTQLEASGSTAGGAGIQLAYDVAKRNYITGGNNRVILCTDGDFNVGVSSSSELERLIEEKRKDNIYLTVIGVGMGNYKDSRMETLADKGNGNYAYIDNLLEGKKVLGKEIWGNLFAVAKDVKIQIEFNPAMVREYRLIGYENRILAREDFNDDTKDAGEMGSGQTVTAFYELIPQSAPAQTGTATTPPPSEPLVFQQASLVDSTDVLAFRLRYKEPDDGQEESKLISLRLNTETLYRKPGAIDEDFRFASAVVQLGMLLRDSPYKGTATYQAAMDLARMAKGPDLEGYRAEFVRLVELAELLDQP